ncbi:MAG: hypothetical protein J5927_07640, partial [Oscillospiraceae bacterium]|nr:hypothetical protein [Oscillospiraceae bacterium]
MHIYVWGTGCGAGDLLDRTLSAEQVEAFLDSAPVSNSFLGRPVLRPEELTGREVDLILVASRQSEGIAARARALGLDPEKLLFTKNNWSLTDKNQSYERAEKFLPAAFLDECRQPPHGVRDPR